MKWHDVSGLSIAVLTIKTSPSCAVLCGLIGVVPKFSALKVDWLIFVHVIGEKYLLVQ